MEKQKDYTELEKQIIKDREARLRKELKPLAEQIRKVYSRAGLLPSTFMKHLSFHPFQGDGFISIGIHPSDERDQEDMKKRLIKKFIEDMEVNIEEMENIKNAI